MVALFGADKNRIDCLQSWEKLQETARKQGLSASSVKVTEKRHRSASLKIQRRRKRLIGILGVAKRFSVGKAAADLGVSRWTVERDLAFLEKHDLLMIRRNTAFPFELQESGEEFMRRFQAAHRA